MSTENYFIRPAEYYKRRISPIKDYVEQMAYYVSRVRCIPYEQAYSAIKQKTINKSFPGMIDPMVHFYKRNEYGDKARTCTRLSRYLAEVISNNHILAPTFTTYQPYSVKQSLFVGFTGNNKKRRKLAKDAGFEAKSKGDMVTYSFKDLEQSQFKTYNNALSGAYAAIGSPFNNPTNHSTLTSTVRMQSSISNASNEKLIGGNRHYFNYDVVLNNLIYMGHNTNHAVLQQALNKYNLVIPTVDDVMDCIRRSTSFYWNDTNRFKRLREFVLCMHPLERANFVYVGDLFQLRRLNEKPIRDFFDKISEFKYECDLENPEKTIKSMSHAVVNLAHLMFKEDVRGFGKDYKLMPKEVVAKIAATSLNIQKTIDEYGDFIKIFLASDLMPASVAYISDMIRRVVPLSDTDSTMFSCDDYVDWYFGRITFEPKGFAIAGAVSLFATETISHLMAILSANLGADQKFIFNISMKPEFVFPVFGQTPVSKHYFTLSIMQEGIVFNEPDYEIKGVHLRNSAVPADIIAESKSTMKRILNDIMANKGVVLYNEIKSLKETEQKIINSLLRGETKYFSRNKIKDPSSYSKGPTESPYRHHVFWNEIWGPEYGKIDEPPYSCIKIPTTLKTKRKILTWIESIQNKQLRDRLTRWRDATDKKALNTLYFSLDHIAASGMPKEVIPIMNIERIVLDLTLSRRLILGTLGYFPKPDMLISHQYVDV